MIEDTQFKEINEALEKICSRLSSKNLKFPPETIASTNSVSIEYDIPLDLARSLVLATNLIAPEVIESAILRRPTKLAATIEINFFVLSILAATLNVSEERLQRAFLRRLQAQVAHVKRELAE